MLRDKQTGAGALSFQVAPGPAGRVEGVRIHLNIATSTVEDLTVSLISASGDEYNVILKVQAMNGLTNFVWTPDTPEPYFPGDTIKVVWANSNARTYGLEVLRNNTG